MNDGDKAESSRAREDVTEEFTSVVRRAGANEFGRAIARIAVAQICQSVGFESFNQSALDSLSDIAIRYLCDLGKTSSSYANLAGRTECNLFDIIQGMEDLGLLRGFPGAAETCPCLLSSGAMQEVIEYVDSAEEVPFAQPVPHFPVPRARKPIPSFSQMGETPGFKHIPDWLPAFPDPHTYIHTPVWNERATDPRADKIELARQRRKAERSLLSLQQRLVSNGAATASTSLEPPPIRVENAGSVNPFLSKPVLAGEKDVSSIALPSKLIDESRREDAVSLLETFAPAIDAMKDAPSESGSHEESILPGRRPAVCLEFKSGKRVLGNSLDLRLKNLASGKTAPWFGQNDEKDDKKRRAEFILRQSMENQQELTQL
ncbi:OLC1v1034506C1 [Oldenlandia corymbosa var. corymbosa]|uniref:Transcription initiation factor TFIID subunit 8 n=1 Tax=Oldenlandia corymbosa var. corymbosa TaxID=529605 RepID=A0AAV1CTX9_OLDCO|nr:OLC1v1034506C1 [Oldenlandia corymbosa var. corymbosa]